MKRNAIIASSLLAMGLFSCKQEATQQDLEVKVADEHSSHTTKKLEVEVVNALDPICEMETAEFLSDTLNYQGQIYGFCSSSCKEEFAKNPEQYLKN